MTNKALFTYYDRQEAKVKTASFPMFHFSLWNYTLRSSEDTQCGLGQVPQSRPLMKRSLQSLCHYGVLREWLPKLGTHMRTWDGLGMWSPWLKLMLKLIIFWRATYKDCKPSLVTWGQPVIMRTARQSLVLGCHLTWTTTYRILPTDFLKTSFFFNYKA